MNSSEKVYYKSPLGWMELCSRGQRLLSVDFTGKKTRTSKPSVFLRRCLKQLDEYFAGRRKRFSLPLHLAGTAFENRIWNELLKIKQGKTFSYREVARRAGNSKAVRAAARAIAKNKIPIIVPCHRVIGSNGKLTGYAYGLKKKAWLLKHERGL